MSHKKRKKSIAMCLFIYIFRKLISFYNQDEKCDKPYKDQMSPNIYFLIACIHKHKYKYKIHFYELFSYVISLLDNYVSISHTMLTVIYEILFTNKNMQVISWTTISILNAYKTCPRDEFIWETY